MLSKPRLLLLLEGAAVVALAVYAYHLGHFRWAWFGILFLAPDLSMLGYLVNARSGAATYNLAHTYTGPIVLLLVALAVPVPRLVAVALVWVAHLGFDRMLGYGLKYPTSFGDTHLGSI